MARIPSPEMLPKAFRFVEQKNATLVRAYLRTTRLDTLAQAEALNALYDQMWLYYM